jgi:hypothetical protein
MPFQRLTNDIARINTFLAFFQKKTLASFFAQNSPKSGILKFPKLTFDSQSFAIRSLYSSHYLSVYIEGF